MTEGGDGAVHSWYRLRGRTSQRQTDSPLSRAGWAASGPGTLGWWLCRQGLVQDSLARGPGRRRTQLTSFRAWWDRRSQEDAGRVWVEAAPRGALGPRPGPGPPGAHLAGELGQDEGGPVHVRVVVSQLHLSHLLLCQLPHRLLEVGVLQGGGRGGWMRDVFSARPCTSHPRAAGSSPGSCCTA